MLYIMGIFQRKTLLFCTYNRFVIASVNIMHSIKASFPTGVASRIRSRIDSMTTIGFPGAEKLIGASVMLLFIR